MYVEVHLLLWKAPRFSQPPLKELPTLVLTRYILKPKVRKAHNLLESKQEEEVQEPEPVDVSSLRRAF